MGWLEDTMPPFTVPIVGALLDVERQALASDMTWLSELCGRPSSWADEVGVEPPVVEGLGRKKLP